MKLSRLEWSDYPPLEGTTQNITIRVGNQNGRGPNPTKTIKDLLSAEGHDWDESSKTWYTVCPADGFCVTEFASQASWSKLADGIEVCFCDYLDSKMAMYHVDAGEWKCIFDNIPILEIELKQ
jgi:DNA helicase-4